MTKTGNLWRVSIKDFREQEGIMWVYMFLTKLCIKGPLSSTLIAPVKPSKLTDALSLCKPTNILRTTSELNAYTTKQHI